MTHTFKLLVFASLITWMVSLALAGCSAPRSEKYQKYQQVAKQNAEKRNAPPIKGGEFYLSHPEATESDYYFALGEAYLSRGQTHKAHIEFAKAVQVNSYHQRALVYLAYFFAQTDDDAMFNMLTRRIRQRDPKSSVLREIVAVRAIRRGDLAKAEKELRKSLKYNRNSLAAHLGLSIVYQRRNEYQRAAAELKPILEKAPDHRIALWELGNCYWKMNQRDRAVEQHDKYLRLSPKSLGVRLQLAKTYRDAGLLDRALTLYEEARRLAPRDDKILVEMAHTYLMRGDADQSLDCLNEIKERSQGSVSPEVRQFISAAYLQKGETAQAEAEIKEGLRRTPHQTALRLHLVSLYLTQKKYTAAIEQCQQVLKADPASFTAQFQLARSYELMGNRDQAIAAYRQILRLQPDLHEVLNNLAYIYARSGTNLNEALRLAQKADKSARNHPTVLDTLGFIYYQRREYDKALKYLTQAKELSKARPSATGLYHLALVYNQKGMKEAAAAEITEALKCNPSPEETQDMQRLIEELKSRG